MELKDQCEAVAREIENIGKFEEALYENRCCEYCAHYDIGARICDKHGTFDERVNIAYDMACDVDDENDFEPNEFIAEKLRAYEDGEPVEFKNEVYHPTGYSWLDDVLDIEFRISADLKYKSAVVACCLGGPNVYFETDRGWVKGYWGSDRWETHVDNTAVDDALEEIYDERG